MSGLIKAIVSIIAIILLLTLSGVRKNKVDMVWEFCYGVAVWLTVIGLLTVGD